MTIITNAEGNALANEFLASFFAGYKANNHEETFQHLLADKLSWKWSDGTEGQGTSTDVVNVLKNGWLAICSDGTYSKPTVVVDTEQGRIVIGHQCICNISGRLPDECNLIRNTLIHVLMVNSDKKVIEWRCIFDNNHEETAEAAAKIVAKCGIDIPKDEKAAPAITREEGEAFVTEFLKGVSAGFVKNNHRQTIGHLHAESVSWDWADGTKGSGSKDEMFDILEKGWGLNADDWIPISPIVAVDTNNSILAFAFNHCVNITGGFAGETNLHTTTLAYCLHLDEDKKITKVNICWDNKHPDLVAIFAKLTPKMEAAAKVSQGVGGTAMQGILSGQ